MNRLTPTLAYRRYLQSNDPSGFPVPWGWGFVLGCVALLFAVSIPIVGVFNLLDATYPQSGFFQDTNAPFAVACLATLTAIWAICKGRYSIDIERFLGLVPLNLRLILPAVAFGVAIAVAGCLANLPFMDPKQHVNSLGYRLVTGVPVTIGFLLTEFVARHFLVAALISPLLEELHRVLLYSWLRRHLNCGASLLVTSFLYAILHGWNTSTAVLFLLGMACGYAYERTRSLLSPYALHGSYNFALTLVDPAARQWLLH